MIWIVAAISFLAGVICPLVASVAFVFCFSIVAATMVAVLAFVFGSSLGLVLVAWIATVVAMQAGFAVTMIGIAVFKPDAARTARSAVPQKPDRSRALP